ncbi:beta-N-acetylhexosaminidase [Austwickia chelonae]|uniref:Putative glycosidase n=1 Tax=Austwickia chelonae NBRC 105200 TaxID=1184607 RepID=K6WBS4_9MICO|nr:glycoside hydrolase family 3 N-terminal domain-containing protein [Austwickia chelonae]GAB79282.1 putative glycosidase [Austwickia chelonae NBRC 105200]SEW37899.1 beta-N-acetylhexosaminidase [Austwickia chelonae]
MSRLAHGVLMTGFSGTRVPDWLAEALADGLAAVCLFAQNTPDLVTTRALTAELRAVHDGAAARAGAVAGGAGGLVIAVDEEGGDVTRLQAVHGSSLPGAAALGAVDDLGLTRRCGRLLGELLAEVGVDLDLAPCVDVAAEPFNPVIGTRSFGADPDVVFRHGAAFAEGLAVAGVASCAKHYPGHGDTRVDSHVDLPVLEAGEDLLWRRDLAPFRDLLTPDGAGCAGVDAVMVGHLVVPSRGVEPASLSSWAAGSIREFGFTGPIVTDALGMCALSDRMSLGEACVRALVAGADLLCLDAPQRRDPEAAFVEAVAAIDEAVAGGVLDPAVLAESAGRNATLVRRSRGVGSSGVFSAEAVRGAEEALRSVGAVAARQALRVTGEVALSGPPLLIDVRRRVDVAADRLSCPFAEVFRRSWVAAEVLIPLDAAEVAAALDVAPVGHHVVVLTARACADPAEGELLKAVLAARPDGVVVHTGVGEAAPAPARLVCAFGSGAANAEAVVHVLTAGGTGGGGA